MRLIDADKLPAVITMLNDLYRKVIDSQPTVAVCCRDCKYWKDTICSYWESDGLSGDDFCSYGKRRDSDAEVEL